MSNTKYNMVYTEYLSEYYFVTGLNSGYIRSARMRKGSNFSEYAPNPG